MANKNPVNKWEKGCPSPNPYGPPRKIKTFDDLIEYVQKAAVEKVEEYWVSEKVWEDLAEMSSMKRYGNMMELMKMFSTKFNGEPNPNGDQPMKIEVVFGNKEKTQTIDISPTSVTTKSDNHE